MGSVMGTGPFGWSDDLLNVYTPSTKSECLRRQSDSSMESNESLEENQDTIVENEGMNHKKKSQNLSFPLSSNDMFYRPSMGVQHSGTIEIQEEPWYTGNTGLRYTSWDKSPNRTFLRNFP